MFERILNEVCEILLVGFEGNYWVHATVGEVVGSYFFMIMKFCSSSETLISCDVLTVAVISL